MRKLCFFTSTRADYGIIRPLLTAVNQSPDAELSLLVTGTHLRPEHGNTLQTIIADGFPVAECVDIFDGSDSTQGTCDAMGKGISAFCQSLERIRPDIFIILGDRFESLAAASAALITRTPVAHLHGGEATFGQYDESARHAITKLSHLHFTSTEAYRLRVIQMGEHPDTVFNAGALGVQNMRATPLLSRKELSLALSNAAAQGDIQTVLSRPYLVVMFHPVTLEPESAEQQTISLLNAVQNTPAVFNQREGQTARHSYEADSKPERASGLTDFTMDENTSCNAVFIEPNADTGRNAISRLFAEFVQADPDKYALIPSLPSDLFFPLLHHAQALAGNSSCGIIEAPSIPIPTVNIGERQAGRIQAASVISCDPEECAIRDALKKALSPEFRSAITACINPYEGDNTAEKILSVLISHPLENIIRKRFYDITLS